MSGKAKKWWMNGTNAGEIQIMPDKQKECRTGVGKSEGSGKSKGREGRRSRVVGTGLGNGKFGRNELEKSEGWTGETGRLSSGILVEL
jgi:hypothetical protein